MIKILFIFALSFLLTGTDALAAFNAKSFASAKRRNPKDGIVVFFYGPDWDARGTKLLKTLWENSEIKNACGNSAMLAVPVFQDPSEKEKKLSSERREGMKVPHIYSYPAIVMYDGDGQKYYLLQGDEIFEETPKVAARIKSKIELLRKQKALLKKAEKQRGLEKAKLYGQAMLEGIDYPPDALKIIKENDPAGETPYAKRLEFDVYKLITSRTYTDKDNPDIKLLTPDDAFELVKKIAIDDATTYLNWQRQELIAACAAYLRRTDKTDARIKTLHKKIREIDPESIWASFADCSESLWLNADKKSNDKKKRKK